MDKLHCSSSAVFQPTMKSEEKVGEDIYTQVARYCHEQIIRDNGMKDLGLFPDLVERNSKIAAKISFDFADAFMRERYERMCVKATGIDLQSLEAHLHDTSLKPL